jgi:hypothetical protein
MGQEAAIGTPIIDEALKLAERIVEDADKGRVDLNDLGRRLAACSRRRHVRLTNSCSSAGVDSGVSTGHFRRMRGQSPHILMSAPQAAPQ